MKKPETEKAKPLSPSARFDTTVSSEEIEKHSKGCILAATTKYKLGSSYTATMENQMCITRSVPS